MSWTSKRVEIECRRLEAQRMAVAPAPTPCKRMDTQFRLYGAGVRRAGTTFLQAEENARRMIEALAPLAKKLMICERCRVQGDDSIELRSGGSFLCSICAH